MSSNDHGEAGTRMGAAADKEPSGYPIVLNTLRHFWVQFVALADGCDLNAHRATGQVFRALEFEVMGHIRLRVALEQIGDDVALVEQIEDEEEDEEERIGDFDKIIEEFLQAAQHWHEAASYLELCASACHAMGVVPEALKLSCQQQRQRIFHLVSQTMELRLSRERAQLQRNNQQEIMFV